MPYIPSTFWGFFNLGELCDSNLLERISFNPFNTICKGGSKTLQESCKQVQKAAKVLQSIFEAETSHFSEQNIFKSK